MDSNRRDFLKKGFVATLASFIPFKLKAQITLDCEPTTTDILGPFFLRVLQKQILLFRKIMKVSDFFYLGHYHPQIVIGRFLMQ